MRSIAELKNSSIPEQCPEEFTDAKAAGNSSREGAQFRNLRN